MIWRRVVAIGDIANSLRGSDNLGSELSLFPCCGGVIVPQTARSSSGGCSYHVLNRGNARATVLRGSDDHDAFLELMAEANTRATMRGLAYWLMPNHFHLALWPREDGDLSAGCPG